MPIEKNPFDGSKFMQALANSDFISFERRFGAEGNRAISLAKREVGKRHLLQTSKKIFDFG